MSYLKKSDLHIPNLKKKVLYYMSYLKKKLSSYT